MAKWVALTVRKLKPGTYADWREAWGMVDGPSGARAYICRKVSDPDEIVAFGIIEASAEEIKAIRPSGDAEEARIAAMAPHIESVESDGLYEVIDEITF